MFVIQSAVTGAFLAPDSDGVPGWVMLLTDAGKVSDYETAAEMIIEHLDYYHKAVIIDLDELAGVR